jgi:hypothetical protein
MRYEEAIKKHEPLSLYESGLVEGLRKYSWMKDGVTYVGTTGTTLGTAVDKAIADARELWPRGGVSPSGKERP